MLHGTVSRHSGENLYLRKFCLIIISLALVSIHIQAQNGWTQKADIPTPRLVASASVVNGKIYVIGGWDVNINELANNEMYDPLTGSWEIKAPLPTPRGCLLTAVVNDSIYAIGGGYSSYKLKVEVYDPVTNTFILFFQAEDGIRDWSVTGVQTCALPICCQLIANLSVRSERTRELVLARQ